MSKEVSVAEILNMDDMVVSSKGYTRKQLEVAFNMIANHENWKNPIDAEIHPDSFDICNEACVFFTGSVLRVVGAAYPDMQHVVADGYYLTIGA